MELWDAYDRDFKKIQGVTLVRGEVIPEGFFHLVCEIIVRHIDGSYLIMQRDKKSIWAECGRLQRVVLHYKVKNLQSVPLENFMKRRELPPIIW